MYAVLFSYEPLNFCHIHLENTLLCDLINMPSTVSIHRKVCFIRQYRNLTKT